MAEQTNMQETVNISSIVNNPINHFDQAINLKIVNTIGLLVKKFSIRNLALLAILLGMESIKKEIINKIPDITKGIYSSLVSWLKILYKQTLKKIIFKMPLVKQTTNEIVNNIETSDEYSNKYDITFSANDVFIKNLYKYLIKTNNPSYTVCEKQMSQEGRDKYKKTILIGDLQCERSNVNIKIDAQFEVNILVNSADKNDFTVVSSKYINYSSIMIENNSANNIFELLPLREFYIDIKQYRNVVDLNDDEYDYDDSFCYVVRRIVSAIHDEYELSCSKWTTSSDIEIILNTAFENESGKESPDMIKIDKHFAFQHTLKIFGVEVDLTDCKYDINRIKYFKDINTNNPKIRQYEFVKQMVTKCAAYNRHPQLKDGLGYELQFESTLVSLRSNDTSKNLKEEWISFLEELNSDSASDLEKNNINIWDMKVKLDKTIIKKGSPKKILNTKNEDGTNAQEIIEAVEEVSETTTSIDFENINSTYKEFSTLYLKEHDDHKLSSTLNNFKHKKCIYKELGLPYKFGVMLYGPPGSGKSSTILAIASYLQKDIYYVDLTNIKTNNDLKTIFNKVNNDVANGGIIVMEDIDVMTNIVHDRALNNYENTDLTLECFLNLLQGSLTKDGSIFIATTNNIDILDPAFIRDGRFDVKLNLSECDHYQMNKIYKKFFSKTIPDKLIKRLPEGTITPATFISKLTPFILSDVNDQDMIEYILK